MAVMVPHPPPPPHDDLACNLGLCTALLQNLLRRISAAAGYVYTDEDGDALMMALLALLDAARAG